MCRPMTTSALAGIRVLDLTDASAEATGRVLADLGAEVIKIEPPTGCESRRTAPFDDASGASLYWRAWGLGKHSVVLDVDVPAERARFIDLARSADVVIESSAPGTMARLGLDYETLRTLNASLVYVSVTPFGQTGPEATSPATDLTLCAAGGFLNCQGDRDRPPVPIGYPETTCSGAVQAAADTVLALYERERTGLGQHLDTSLQAAIPWTLLFVTGYGSFGMNPPNMGDDRANPSQSALTIPVFCRTADGFLGMTLVLGTPGARSLGRMMRWAASFDALDADLAQHDWTDLFPLMGAGKLSPADAQRGLDQLVAFFATRSKHEIHQRAVEERWLVAPCYTAEDLFNDPHLAARDYWTDVDGLAHPGPFAKLTATPIVYRRPAPSLGQDQALAPRTETSVAKIPAEPRKALLLEGLKIADFAWVGAGPLVSKDLANLGATVIHVESTSAIDPLRIIPPWKDSVPNHETGHTSCNFNQSKLGLALNLSGDGAKGVIGKLIDWADVVVESFVPGTAQRFGLDYDAVRARRPDIVMLSSCLRGQTGPERTYTGFGLQGAALAGFAAITGWADRLPCGPFAAYTDFIAPRYSIAALGAALVHRQRTGQGQYIDLSQIEAAMHFLEPLLLDYHVNGRVAGLQGTDCDRASPNGVYRTQGTERFIAISIKTADQWAALCREVPALEPLRALSSLSQRQAARAAIDNALTEACAGEEGFALAARLRRAGVPAYMAMRGLDLHDDPQLAHRGFFVELDHPRIGPLRYDGAVSAFSATPHRPTHAGPTIGQHTEHVMRDILAYTDDEITELAAAGTLS